MKFDNEKLKKTIINDWPIILLYAGVGLVALIIFILMPSFVLGTIVGATVYANKNKIMDWIDGNN